MIVLIPAYEPDAELVALVERLVQSGEVVEIVVVNDGSGPDYEPVFDAVARLGCSVIGHAHNRGKGYALKRGFEYAESHFPGQDVVCADCDGQHSVVDIVRVARVVAANPDAIVLGSRRFTGRVPATSRFGNTVTRVLFARSTGRRLYDTQTGLRGYSHSMLPWLCRVDGDRFEYELNLLLLASEAGMTIQEVPIQTIYIEGNKSSHFRPLIDSARVYAPLVKFSLSSIAAFAIDVILLFGMAALTGNLLLSVVTARVVSSNVNFVANRRLVFQRRNDGTFAACALRYFTLVVAIMGANYALLHTLYERIGLNLVAAKFMTEAVLFVASYQIQKRVVFASPAHSVAEASAVPATPGGVRRTERNPTAV